MVSERSTKTPKFMWKCLKHQENNNKQVHQIVYFWRKIRNIEQKPWLSKNQQGVF